MASGDTKTEQYLDIAANGSRSDFPSSCCETRSQTLIREVGERIMDVEDEVEEMKNNPDVADIVATYADLQAYDTQHLTDKDIIRVLTDGTHDDESTYYRYDKSSDSFTYIGTSKTYSNFVGTDGTAAGAAGLVPAPATTDVDKFLKSDGTWATAGGGSDINVVQTTGTSTTDVMSQKAVTDAIAAIPTGGDAFTELTSSDYNYPADNPDGVALWLLPLGLYKFADGVKVYLTSSVPSTATTSNPRYVGVMRDNVGSITGNKFIIEFAYFNSSSHSRVTMRIYTVSNNGISNDYQNASYVLRSADIYNGLTQTSTGFALDASQGKVLNDKITALEARVVALEGN